MLTDLTVAALDKKSTVALIDKFPKHDNWEPPENGRGSDHVIRTLWSTDKSRPSSDGYGVNPVATAPGSVFVWHNYSALAKVLEAKPSGG